MRQEEGLVDQGLPRPLSSNYSPLHSFWNMGGGNRGEDGDEGDEIIFPFILQRLALTCNAMPR